jgi:hypothetical protein
MARPSSSQVISVFLTVIFVVILFGIGKVMNQREAITSAVVSQKINTEVAQNKPTPKPTIDEEALRRYYAERSAENETNKVLLSNKLSTLRQVYDQVEDLAFYSDWSSPQYSNINGFFLSLGYSGKMNLYNLFLRIQYTGEDWLFIDGYTISIDGKNYYYKDLYFDVKRDNNTKVWEVYSRPVNDADIKILKEIINSTQTIIRCQGKDGRYDMILTYDQKMALKNVLDCYELATN